jgi:hypothetical protein
MKIIFIKEQPDCDSALSSQSLNLSQLSISKNKKLAEACFSLEEVRGEPVKILHMNTGT